LERAAGVTLYQSYRWNHAAARLLKGTSPCVVAVENGGGAAIIPAAVEDGCLTFLGDVLFDYRDVLSNDDEALVAAWRVIRELQRPLHFLALRDDSPHEFWSAAERSPFCGAPSISLDDISAEQFARRHWRQAKQVRRLLREGATLLHTDGSHSGLVRWIYEQKAAQLAGDPNNVFADPSRIDFMVAMAAAESSRCDVYGFEIGGRIISSLITFRDDPPGARPVRRYYTTAFDHGWWRFSPGIALLYEVARQSLEEGMDVDLQTGEQFHKSRLATRSTPLYRVSLSADQVGRLAEAATGSARAAA
jgi:CelD/BcsL family acetyltransferase involved in cellulose biosynthesis